MTSSTSGPSNYPTSGTDYMVGGIAIRYVGGTPRLVAGKNGNNIYECTIPTNPTWGATQATWPQATVIYDWGSTLYGVPSMITESMPPSGHSACLGGLMYDAAANPARFYFSWGDSYNMREQLGQQGLGGHKCPRVARSPWSLAWQRTTTAMNHKIRGGTTIIPD